MRPAPPLLACLFAWAAIGLLASLEFVPASTWTWSGIALAAAALLDGVRLWRAAPPDVSRIVPEAFPIGVERDIGLRIEAGARALRADVHDLHPEGWSCTGLPRTLHVAAGTSARFDYRLRPEARGDFAFDGVHVRLASPWRLWHRARVLGAPQSVRVYPNFAPLARLALLSADQASRLVGAHVKRRRGEGTDFHQMRDYRVGDSLRQVDWKATSRMRRLISREYQDERNQQLLVVIDTGRRMLARDGALTHFDRVLDAALVVSYLALRQGDAVGLLATGGDPCWVAPQRGLGAIDTLLRATYDLQPRPVATDYLAAATELATRQARRSLVMLVTNLRDEDIDDVLAAVRMLQRRHQVVVASLREDAVDAALEADAPDLASALRTSAAAQYLEQRAAAHDALRRHRVQVVDVTCAELPAALVERYLAIKRDGSL
ncbi:membrane protein [Lysobacter helvus]|uniref:Membrane protein n=2 Tax=Lysobacteraceae TaxID=32033 RepID=A0ABM7Q4B0_9GAMM|nr:MULTISPECIES: DUF58 domain-containing protein [Lysobacter]BCT92141.1 membrane protein [Lysobacter caseinilyticus]BCT95294.1 membrane protein [Lysobacter helvus]